MRTYYDCDLVSAGIIITRSAELNDIFKTIYDYDGKTRQWKPILRKYGASTTWMGKLTYRLGFPQERRMPHSGSRHQETVHHRLGGRVHR